MQWRGTEKLSKNNKNLVAEKFILELFTTVMLKVVIKNKKCKQLNIAIFLRRKRKYCCCMHISVRSIVVSLLAVADNFSVTLLFLFLSGNLIYRTVSSKYNNQYLLPSSSARMMWEWSVLGISIVCNIISVYIQFYQGNLGC